jgi:DNA-binding IclR family transcriptional regulator
MEQETKTSKKEMENMVHIINALKKNPGGLWVRELSRQTKLHMETVRRIVDKYPAVFQEYADFTAYKINLKIIRLANPNIDSKNIGQYLELKKRVGDE